jgi:hypothetical protein
MLDYVVTFDQLLGAGDDVEAATWEDHRARIEAFLADKMPGALASFQAYANLIGNTDESKERVWQAPPDGLSILSNQGLVERIPSNCTRSASGGGTEPDLTQIVLRREVTTDTTTKVYYIYDAQRFNQMRQEQPLQFAYLIVHEWLWDFTDNPWIDRQINHLIHTKHGAAMTRAQFSSSLKALGVDVEGSGQVGPQGPEEQALRQTFANHPLCNMDQRFSFELMRYDPVNRIILGPGEMREFPVQVPSDLLPPVQRGDGGADDFSACGFAFMMTYRGTGGDSVPFHFELWRGVAKFERDLAAPSTTDPQQEFYAGMCAGDNPLCIERDGDLAELLTPQNFQQSKWTLRVTNNGSPGSGGGVELLAPYFVFVQMRQP